jgi:hypothetical protein
MDALMDRLGMCQDGQGSLHTWYDSNSTWPLNQRNPSPLEFEGVEITENDAISSKILQPAHVVERGGTKALVNSVNEHLRSMPSLRATCRAPEIRTRMPLPAAHRGSSWTVG